MEHNLKLKITSSEFKKFFATDVDARWVFHCKLRNQFRVFSFEFAQSYELGNTKPTLEQVLVSLPKSIVGMEKFSDFCDKFGYDKKSSIALREHKMLLKQYKGLAHLFKDEIIPEEILNIK